MQSFLPGPLEAAENGRCAPPAWWSWGWTRGLFQGALSTPSWSREAEVGLMFSLTARTKSLFMMDSSLVEPCLNSPIKSRSGLKALNESQSGFYFFFKASSGSKRSLASVHGRWLRRCFSTLYIANFDLNLLLPLLQKAHVFLLVWEISRAIPWDRLSGKGVGKAQCHPLVGQWPIPEATPGSLQSAEPAALPS